MVKSADCLLPLFVLVHAPRHASTCNILLRAQQTRSQLLQLLICVPHNSLISASVFLQS